MSVGAENDLAGTSSRLPMQALAMSIPAIIFCVTALSITLTAAAEFGLTERETTSLIIALYGLPGALSLVLTFVYRQPLLIAWNTGSLIFLASLANEFTYSEAVGAAMASAVLVLVSGATGLTSRLAALVPPSIIFGVLAGLVMPYVVRAFNEGGSDVTMIGGTIVAYFLGRRLLPSQVPPLLPAMVVGFGIAGVTGQMHASANGITFSVPAVIVPTFSMPAMLTMIPVMFALVVFQGNLAGITYLRSQGYNAPEKLLVTSTATASALGSFLGPAPIGVASLLTPLTAGPDAGPWNLRHWSVYASGVGLVMIAFSASLFADLPSIIPLSLLLTLAGLALSGVLAQALAEITRGPLRVGPLFAFVVASSQMAMLGLGPVFWAIVIGTAVSLLLEQESVPRTLASA